MPRTKVAPTPRLVFSVAGLFSTLMAWRAGAWWVAIPLVIAAAYDLYDMRADALERVSQAQGEEVDRG